MIVAAALLFVGSTAACGGEEDGPGNGGVQGPNNENDVSLDAGNADAPDVGDTGDADASVTDGDLSEGDAATDAPDADADPGDTSCQEVSCQAGEVCVDGTCLEETPARKCQLAEDLGTLTLDSPIVVSSTTAEASDVLTATCSSGGNEVVYKFDVAQDSLVSFESDFPEQFDAVFEFRQNACESPADEDVSCFDGNNDLSVAAGTTVYLVVEQTLGRGNDFDFTLSAAEETCPAGVERCDAGTFEVCTGGTSSQTFACADTCADAEVCSGSLCSNAIAVSGSASFGGDLGAYQANIDFSNNSLCTVDTSTVSTPGREVIFELQGLDAGQTVTINTGPNVGIFIAPSCSQSIVCEEAFVASGTNSSVAWTVPSGVSDESYFVIIDKQSTTAGSFSYGFDITGP
ncbi:hypothetical protein FRD00_04335 [Persicimonas caeni]|nr:hypothetical protein [Persicimonas caeni]QED31216.1 hypothetical protein FRD00_04335 [Persicimonas caeni]